MEKKKKILSIVIAVPICLILIVLACVLPFVLSGKDGVATDGTQNQNQNNNNNNNNNNNGSDENPDSGTLKEYVQDLDYSEDIDLVFNPDQGFYKAQRFTVEPTGITYSSGKEAERFSFSEDFQITHMRMDISAFSHVNNGGDDILLTDEALNDLDLLLSKAKASEKSIVIRFCYCPGFGDQGNSEPEVEMIYEHIKQISKVLNKYQATITAIEAGMLGRWGEMNGSDILDDKNVVNGVIDAWLDNTSNFAVLVRQPKFIYDYLGITYEDIDSYTIEKSSKAYRLGLFDDGFLGSESDLGTFRHDRVKEVEWSGKQTSHLPFGGEATFSSSEQERALYTVEKGCLSEMRNLHLSYLNNSYNETVTGYWRETNYDATCGDDSLYYGSSLFDYIAKHMGYRYVLNKSTFKYNDSASIFNAKLELKNVGFSSITKKKDMQVVIVKDGETVLKKRIGTFDGQTSIDFSLELELEKGEYEVYLSVSSLDGGNETYPVRFANHLYNETLKANKIGKIVVA